MLKYKFMTKDRQGPYSHYDYPEKVLPALEGDVVECEHGWHACSEEQLYYWFNFRVMEVEADSWVEFGDKCATTQEVHILREGTLDIVAFAQACAERAQGYAAVSAAAYAVSAAAYAADAASAAYTAAYATDAAAYATDAAAYAAAKDAAKDVAYAAAKDAAKEAERCLQNKWILEHIQWQ
jgi:hypothetical protein